MKPSKREGRMKMKKAIPIEDQPMTIKETIICVAVVLAMMVDWATLILG